MNKPLEDEQWSHRFNWWWRSVFVDAKTVGKDPQQWTEFSSLLNHLRTGNKPARRASGAPQEIQPSPIDGKLLGLLNQERQRSAFLYELCKRIKGTYEFNKPWIELNEVQWQELENRWPATFQQHIIYEVNFCNQAPIKAGWTQRLPASWNMHLNDGTLTEYFRKFINSERARLNIPNPRQHAGRPLRPISWRPIELLDIDAHKLQQLSPAQHSQISKAKKLWKTKVNNS